MVKIFRDPIAQFVLIGLILVTVNLWWSDWQGERGRTIILTSPEIARLEKIWAASTGRRPSGEDRQQIINEYIQEEVLVREAERLGLGEGDTIIRRRLAQKMDFIAGEKAIAADPSPAELEKWFNAHRDQFAAPELRSFTLVYFSPEKHGDKIEKTALTARAQLQSGADWRTIGDPFIQKRTYAAVPQTEITRLFGPEFADAIFKLAPGTWSQPIGSAFGLHLVRIDTIDSAASAEFEPIQTEILSAWRDEQRELAKRAAVAELVDGYKIVVEGGKK